MLKTRKKQFRIGPDDHGKRMSLAEFDTADGQEGYLYELSRGVIEVDSVPHPSHWLVLEVVRNELTRYTLAHPDQVSSVAQGDSSKVLVDEFDSERHPDISVYLSPMPDVHVKDLWSTWVPQIAVEIVSERLANRDYELKPPEYLAFGVTEYWIVDPLKHRVTVLSRYRGGWKETTYAPSQKIRTPLLPGFALDLKRVFAKVAGR